MTCPRVAVFSSSSVGTVNRFLPIVSELVLRKCEVRYYIADPAFERVIQHTGAAAELFDDFLGCWPDLLAEDADWFQRGKLPSVVQEHHDLERYFYALPAGVCLARRLLKLWEAPGAWVPSLVIYSVADLHPCLVSAKLGIPCVAVVSCFLLDRYPACLPDEQQSSWPAVIAEHEGVQAANMIAQDEFGTNCLKEFLPCRYFSRCLNIIVSIPDVESEDLEKPWMKELSFVWVGFTGNQTYHINGVFVRDANKLHRLPSDVSAVDCPWRMPLPGGVKILVVSLGSEIVGEGWNILHKCDSKPFTGRDFSRRVWRELVESFRGRNDVRVVMAIGPQPDAAEGLGKIPGNFIARRSDMACTCRCDLPIFRDKFCWGEGSVRARSGPPLLRGLSSRRLQVCLQVLPRWMRCPEPVHSSLMAVGTALWKACWLVCPWSSFLAARIRG